ncbi:histidine triad nucleotide-binding protein [Pararhodospirillum photometricum]|nr:histidine triad nucleotide-binding protein [Pararhodospirillum photometricum]
MAYDETNVFARILKGEIPCRKVHEDEHILAFHDINPQAPVHVLVIPKGAYTDWDDFAQRASEAEIARFIRGVAHVGRLLGVDEPGYRVMSNKGVNGGQEVPHLHVHLFAGRKLGRMVPAESV